MEEKALSKKKIYMIEGTVIGIIALLALVWSIYKVIITIANDGDLWTEMTISFAAIGTIGVFTMLYRENPVSRFFEHILLGVSVGYGFAYTLTVIIWPYLVQRVIGYDGQPVSLWWLLTIPPGMLFYFQLSRKYNWLSKLIICFFMGSAAGNVFKMTFNIIFTEDGQITKSITSLIQPTFVYSVEAVIVFVVSLSVLSYFFFSFRHEVNPILRESSKWGRYFLMISFGAIFGNTVMGRMSLLIDRLGLIYSDWLGLI